ncbi:hypothetical protein Bbelb_315280 [Branchiostoma belcheri]|nr:hypothetical protein Bbelb_315280 [Branchiostoma belcheri]
MLVHLDMRPPHAEEAAGSRSRCNRNGRARCPYWQSLKTQSRRSTRSSMEAKQRKTEMSTSQYDFTPFTIIVTWVGFVTSWLQLQSICNGRYPAGRVATVSLAAILHSYHCLACATTASETGEFEPAVDLRRITPRDLRAKNY